jgi:hypothetical protein
MVRRRRGPRLQDSRGADAHRAEQVEDSAPLRERPRHEPLPFGGPRPDSTGGTNL